MAVEIDERTIDARARDMRRWESPSLDLWVVVPDLDRHLAAEKIQTALRNLDDAEMVYPTTGGTYVFISDAGQVDSAVVRIATYLDAHGLSGTITAPATFDDDALLKSDVASLAALLAFSMTPPVSTGPFNDRGIPTYRWGVPIDTTQKLLRTVTAWATNGEHRGQTGGGGPLIPVGPEDAPEILELRVRAGQQDIALLVPDPDAGAKIVSLSTFGQVSLADVPLGGASVASAERLADVLRANAADLDVAAIRPMHPAQTNAFFLPGGARWIWNRHQWSARVADVAGIQLLTSEHLDHASDLSDWRVEKVATDRWLVSAQDLTHWYDEPAFSAWYGNETGHAEHLEAARHDFGDMILSDETAWRPGMPYPGS